MTTLTQLPSISDRDWQIYRKRHFQDVPDDVLATTHGVSKHHIQRICRNVRFVLALDLVRTYKLTIEEANAAVAGHKTRDWPILQERPKDDD